MRFIHAADIHLDSPLVGLSSYQDAPADLLRGATRAAFTNLVSEAIELQVDFMIIAGDLYDGPWKDHNTGIYFSKEIGRLKKANIPVYLLYGNHDAESEMTKQLQLPDNVYGFGTRKCSTFRIEHLKVALHGRSFKDAATYENLVTTYPAPEPGMFNIGVLHTALEGNTVHAPYAPCSLDELHAKGYDYWALTRLEEQLEAAKGQLDRFSSEWTALTVAAGLDGLPLDDALDWIRKKDVVLERGHSLLEAQKDSQFALNVLADATQELRTVLEENGVAPGSVENLSALCIQAEHLISEADGVKGRRDTLNGQLVTARQVYVALQDDLVEARKEAASWAEDWASTLSNAGLDAAYDTGTVEGALELIGEIEEKARKVCQIQAERIDTMKADLALFAEDVEALCGAIAAPLNGQEPAEAVQQLVIKVRLANQARDEQERLTTALRVAEQQVAELETTKQQAEAVIEPLKARAGVSTREALAECIAQSDEKRRLLAEDARLRRELITGGDGQSRQDIEAEIAVANLPEIATDIATLSGDLTTVVERQGTLSAELATAEATLTAIGGSDAAAQAEGQRQEALSKMADAAERYVKVFTAINEEACLVRELPAGEAVRMLGLDEVLSSAAGLDAAKVPSFSPADDIPLPNLEAKIAGRFELSGNLLRWWPPTSLATKEVTLQLLDELAEPVGGTLTPVGSQRNPATYRFDGTVAPHFARVRSGAFESSLAVVVVEQAIQQTQRRATGRGVENALDLLDDEASEGLWLLEVIQRLTEAEHEVREPRGVTEQQPQGKAVAEQAPDSRVLPYEEFVAGRRVEGSSTALSSSHLASTHHESVRSFLNALIGKRAALDLAEALDEEDHEPNLGLGDETSDGAAAMESGDLPSTFAGASGANQMAESKRQLERRQRYVEDTQCSIVDGVEAFLKGLREQVQGQLLSVVDLLRLRVLLVVVLAAGSKKTDLRPKDLNAQVHRRQVLPSRGEASWRRLVGRLLYDFFRDHVGTRAPLIKSLRLESDNAPGLPEDVLECWATCFWALCAMRVAVDDAGASFAVSSSEAALAADLYRFTSLLPQQAFGAVVQDVFAGMNCRYAERLGVSAERIELEHRGLVHGA